MKKVFHREKPSTQLVSQQLHINALYVGAQFVYGNKCVDDLAKLDCHVCISVTHTVLEVHRTSDNCLLVKCPVELVKVRDEDTIFTLLTRGENDMLHCFTATNKKLVVRSLKMAISGFQNVKSPAALAEGNPTDEIKQTNEWYSTLHKFASGEQNGGGDENQVSQPSKSTEDSVFIGRLDSFKRAAEAIKSDNEDELKRLVDNESLILHGRDETSQDSLLHLAVFYGSCLQQLLLRNVDVNMQGAEENTALHVAVKFNAAAIETLLNDGAHMNALNQSLETPLHILCGIKEKNYNYKKEAELLIEWGASLELRDVNGKRPSDLDPELCKIQRNLVHKKMLEFCNVEIELALSNDGNCWEECLSSPQKEVRTKLPHGKVNRVCRCLLRLSENEECYTTIVSYFGYKKTLEKIQEIAKCTNFYYLYWLKDFLINLFHVNGEIAQNKKKSNVLAKVAILLLESPEPVKGCSWVILNSLLNSQESSITVVDENVYAIINHVRSSRELCVLLPATPRGIRHSPSVESVNNVASRNGLIRSDSFETLFEQHNFSTQLVMLKLLAGCARETRIQQVLLREENFQVLVQCLASNKSQVEALRILCILTYNIHLHTELQFLNIEQHLLQLLQRRTNNDAQYHATLALVCLGRVRLSHSLTKHLPKLPIHLSHDKTHILGCSVDTFVYYITVEQNQLEVFLLDASSDNSCMISLLIRSHKMFVNSLVLLRLFLHFLWHALENDLKQVRLRLIKALTEWLKSAAKDFEDCSLLRNELDANIPNMTKHAKCTKEDFKELRELLNREECVTSDNKTGVCHEQVYVDCKRMMENGQLPCPPNVCVKLTALNVYVENVLRYGERFYERVDTVRHFGKRVLPEMSPKDLRYVLREYKQLLKCKPTEREAKHTYISACKELPGYQCLFFPATFQQTYKRKAKVFLGISAKSMVILSDNDKQCLKVYPHNRLITFSASYKERWLKIVIQSKTSGANKEIRFADVDRINDLCDVLSLVSVLKIFPSSKVNLTELSRCPDFEGLYLNSQQICINRADTDISPNKWPELETSSEACFCPLPLDFGDMNLEDFSTYELLQHTDELARQIALFDHKMFKRITTDHILHRVNIGEIKRNTFPPKDNPITQFADSFNKLSSWVTQSIVGTKDLQKRSRLYANFVIFAQKCVKYNDFNAALAIVVCGLGCLAVKRLKCTEELVPSFIIKTLREMETLLDSSKNFTNYRTKLEEVREFADTPVVPYFGLMLKDFTFVNDGNSDAYTSGVLNLIKFIKIDSMLEEVRSFQLAAYNFKECEAIQKYLKSRTLIESDVLFKLSKDIEPPIDSNDELATRNKPKRRRSLLNIINI